VVAVTGDRVQAAKLGLVVEQGGQAAVEDAGHGHEPS
jgi:hypothetical protein